MSLAVTIKTALGGPDVVCGPEDKVAEPDSPLAKASAGIQDTKDNPEEASRGSR
jgi:hypothetical protein